MTQEQEIAQLRAALDAGEARWRAQFGEMDVLKNQLIEAQRAFLDMYNYKNEVIFKLRSKVKKLRGAK